MKKTIITVLLLISSVTAFANSSNKSAKSAYTVDKVSVASMALNIFSNLDLEVGSRLGSCEIIRKDYTNKDAYHKEEFFSFQIRNQNKTVGITVKNAGKISTSKDATHLILSASSQNTNKGIKTTKELMIVVKTENFNIKVSELILITRQTDSNGIRKVLKNQSILCKNN